MSYKKRIIYFSIVDSFLIFSAVFTSYILRFDGQIPYENRISIPYTMLLIWITTYGLFFFTKHYKRVWEYAGISELVSIIKVTTISIILDVGLYYLLKNLGITIGIPRTIFLISWMTIVFAIAGSRFIWRVFPREYEKVQPHHRLALIVGAGKAGALVAHELKSTNDASLFPIAFIDDDIRKLNLEVAGLPVIGNRSDILEVVEQYNIDTIIIAIPSAQKKEIAKVIDICTQTRAQVKLLPRVSDVIHGKVSIKLIRDVNVEDLLGRDEVSVDLEEIANYVTNKVVLVTGAGGSIGSELCRQITTFHPEKLLLLGHGENSIYTIEQELRRRKPDLKYETLICDIQDRDRIEEIFKTYRPSVVFHAAAHKHVPLMEKNPIEAVKNNIFGTKNVAECAHLYGSEKFVLISTDKAVNPTSVMGVTKRIAELIIQSLDSISSTKFAAVRFGNVLGSRGSVIPLFKQQIEEGGPVTVTHPDMVRYFMTIPEAVQLVIQAGALAKGGEVFILDMGNPVRIADLARDLIRLSGFEPEKEIKIIYSGIRPGEKLFEELLTDEEGTTATKHNRIFVGKPINCPIEYLSSILKTIEEQIIGVTSPEQVREILFIIVSPLVNPAQQVPVIGELEVAVTTQSR
ncbi:MULTISPECIES: polysaccharide biosynthesis protein [unclassified Brevibacillus]|uniref:polysaccharide biosynthesis protein n=1 Tax=unclassified Brevibacillus TaxID=2684853 RepID=UPI0035612A0C